MPPGPVIVTRRSVQQRRTSAISFSRPTKLVTGSGQVVGQRSERLERGKIGLQPGRVQLVNVLGRHQVFQAVLAQVDAGGAWRQVILHQVVGGLGEQHLPAVARGSTRATRLSNGPT